MYGLSPTFNPSVFVGKVLNQVCFSENTLGLSFDNDIGVTVMSSFIYKEKLSTAVNKQSVPVNSSKLMGLLGKRVDFATASPDGMLTLHFENQDTLILLDDSTEYESYIIRIGDKETIV